MANKLVSINVLTSYFSQHDHPWIDSGILSHQASHNKIIFLSFLQPNKVKKNTFSFQNLY